jgi:hypothetical protein
MTAAWLGHGSMERGEQKSSNGPSQEEWSCVSEQRRTILAVTQMLNSGALDKESTRLLGQLPAALGSESSLGAV